MLELFKEASSNTFFTGPRVQVVVRSDGPFSVYAVDADGEVLYLVGPSSADKRTISFRLLDEKVAGFKLRAHEPCLVEWLVEPITGNAEKVDPVPLEIPVDRQRPLTLREEMMRFIRTEISAQAERAGTFGSFEEEDDFSDEDGEIYSPYEVVEMDEEDGVGYPVEPTEKPVERENDIPAVAPDPSESPPEAVSKAG